MEIFKKNGTKGRLFEMMERVNKTRLTEGDIDNGLSYDPQHPANRPVVGDSLSLEQSFDKLMDKFKGMQNTPTKWDIMSVVGTDYQSWMQEGYLAWKIANGAQISDRDLNGVNDFVKKYVKEKYMGGVEETFDYNAAERDVHGQQDLDQHQQDNETSKELAMLLKTSPEEFKNKIQSMPYVPAFVKAGGMMDGQLNPIGLGFRDLENAGLISVMDTMTAMDSNDDSGETEVSNMTVLSEIPIYGVDTGKYYKKGETIQ